MQNVNCLNCNRQLQGKYCSNCGQSANEHAINAHYFLHDIPHSVLHIDKGFFYTLISMFTRPGKMIEDYIKGRRVAYFKPLAYVLILTTVCTFLLKLVHLAGGVSADKSFFSKYFSLFIFLMIPISSLVTWLTFSKRRLNFWEHVLANTYLAAQINIVLLLITLVTTFFHISYDSTWGNILFNAVFLASFLFLYGYAFGYLFSDVIKPVFWLVLRISIMNTVLALLYVTAFRITRVV